VSPVGAARPLDSAVCAGKGADPHKSAGEAKKGRHVMLAKVTVVCTGDADVSELFIDAKLQKKVGKKWRNATSNNKTSHSKVKMGKKYVGYTKDLKCQKGTFRVYFRASGVVDDKMIYGNWAAGKSRKNPCG
jgi:hypothetical protein